MSGVSSSPAELAGRRASPSWLRTSASPQAPLASGPREPSVGLRRQLARCGRETRRAEVRALAEDAVRLAWSAAEPAPPGLRDRVLSAVRTTPQEPAPAAAHAPRLPPHVWGTRPPPARARRSRPRPLFVPFATATAAAALVVAALFAVQADRTRDELAVERDRAREIAHVLAAGDARAASGRDGRGGTIGVIASASEGRAVVTLRGYGEPPGERVHQLWVMRPHAQPRSLGLFDGDTPLVA
ncbi:Regulator of SigK OS=Streptomyces glaucescens OX=1907 GN=SGLAU_07550 PE=4 SV=1 [Streptomyces glaucescens]